MDNSISRRLGGFSRNQLTALAGALVATIGVVAVAAYLLNSPATGLHASLDVSNPDHVRILDPITVRFDHAVDLSQAQVEVTPSTRFTLADAQKALTLRPADRWQPGKKYTLHLAGIRSKDGKLSILSWSHDFITQPVVSVAGYQVNGQAVSGTAPIPLRSQISVAFTVPMKTDTVTLTNGGQPIPATQLSWAAGGTSVTLANPVLTPYSPITLSVARGALSARKDPLSDPGSVTLVPQALEPSNAGSGVTPGFKTVPPLEVVIENSGAARPQAGLQEADMVFEYISEYNIPRVTALYFNQPPALMGPVRSCRMVNPYLNFAFTGLTMCSGASVGTLHYMFGDSNGIPLVPGTINDFDRGNHFFRGPGAAPHNLWTDHDRATRLRSEWPLAPGPSYQIDPPHPDNGLGTPFDAPAVGLHHVNYAYDPASQQYLRWQDGAPFTDRATGAQLRVKNVVLMNVGFRDAGWIEDDNGGAHSVWYLMNGTGTAQIWSDGKLVNATWHLGGQSPNYWENRQPIWFTDESGKPIELNTGLTWIHVLGIGQTS